MTARQFWPRVVLTLVVLALWWASRAPGIDTPATSPDPMTYHEEKNP